MLAIGNEHKTPPLTQGDQASGKARPTMAVMIGARHQAMRQSLPFPNQTKIQPTSLFVTWQKLCIWMSTLEAADLLTEVHLY